MTKNKTLLLFTLLCSLSLLGQNQVKLIEIEIDKLPGDIKYEGQINNAIRWLDTTGDNIVITTETGISQNEKFKHENEGLDAELFAYHFIRSKNTAELTWKVYDFISDCPVDIEANFIKNTLQVTDLNADGVAEVWIMYTTACHGDVSPSDMKIIMYQGLQKYAMRGQNKVKISDNVFYGGDYNFDKAFIGSPSAFKQFAKKLWSKNILQKWGE